MSLISVLKELEQTKRKLKGLIEEVTVVFIDMAESTAYKNEKGIELGVAKVIKFNLDTTKIIKKKAEECKEKGEIEKYEICKYVGDEVMVYFKGNRSSKVAVEIAIDIQKYFKSFNMEIKNEFEGYKSKVGIDFGEVLFAQYDENLPLDPQGLVVDRAARIISLAKPYQILISEQTKNNLNGFDVNLGKVGMRKLRGIKEDAGICEVIWDKKLGELKIKLEEATQVLLVPADEPSVYRFITDNALLKHSEEVDLILYTYETLAGASRSDLEKFTTPITFNVIIRNPLKDSRKAPFIEGSVSIMSELINMNPNVNFNVRLYDYEPLLRTYIFKKKDAESKALLSLYRYDPQHRTNFIGAEDNYLIYAKGSSFFERHLLSLFQSRFNCFWNTLTKPKAVIFDLDGVIVDSMPSHYQAWKEVFCEIGIDINKEEIYRREGEKSELTTKAIYKKFKNEEPSPDLVKVIVKRREKIYKEICKFDLLPEIPQLVTILKNKNVKLAIVTGSLRQSIQQFLKQENLFKLFDVIITGEDTSNGKPAPDLYRIAVDKLEVPSTNCYVVENGPLGIKSAVNAGLTCLAVKGTSPLPIKALKDAGAHFVYKNITELKRHLVWADVNMNLTEFINTFENVL